MSLITAVAIFTADGEVVKVVCALELTGGRAKSIEDIRGHSPCSFSCEVVIGCYLRGRDTGLGFRRKQDIRRKEIRVLAAIA